jgi:hypothetical protein
MSEAIPKSATRCAENRGVNVNLGVGTRRGTIVADPKYLLCFQSPIIHG